MVSFGSSWVSMGDRTVTLSAGEGPSMLWCVRPVGAVVVNCSVYGVE